MKTEYETVRKMQTVQSEYKTPDGDWQEGFSLRFENGWTISVQWGNGTYSSNTTRTPTQPSIKTSRTAEVAAFNDGGLWWDFDQDMIVTEDTNSEEETTKVFGFVKTDEVVLMISSIQNLYMNEYGFWRNGLNV